VTKLTTVVQGIQDQQRIGDMLMRKQLNMSYTITVGATGLIAAADQFNTVRVIVFEWKEDDGLTTPVVANIIDTSVSTAKTLSPINYDVKHDFKVLYDKSHVVFNTPVWNGAAVTWSHGVGGTFATQSPIVMQLKGKIEFDANSANGVGHLFVLTISDSAFTPNPTCEFVSQLRYTDD